MFDRLVGNERLKKMLARDIDSGTLAHGYIAEGAPGSGKHTLAYGIAAALAGADRDGEDRIRAGLCPDVIVVGRTDGRKTIGVETVRDIGYRASVTPNEFDFKLTVIEDADSMTVQAQNAFLKLLEEPPSRAYFLMLCENASAMLPTIRSRAATLRLEKCSLSDMDTWLTENSRSAVSLASKDRREYERILRASNGCIGTALSMLGSGISDRFDSKGGAKSAPKRAAELLRLASDRRTAPLVSYIVTLGSERAELCTVLSLFAAAVRDLILCKAHMREEDRLFTLGREAMPLSEDALCFYEDVGQAQELSSSLSFSELLSMAEAADDALERVQMNGNVRQILIRLGSSLKTVVCR